MTYLNETFKKFIFHMFIFLLLLVSFVKLYVVLVSGQVLICLNNKFLRFQDEISLEVSFTSL